MWNSNSLQRGPQAGSECARMHQNDLGVLVKQKDSNIFLFCLPPLRPPPLLDSDSAVLGPGTTHCRLTKKKRKFPNWSSGTQLGDRKTTLQGGAGVEAAGLGQP